jgi:hypothetical protein
MCMNYKYLFHLIRSVGFMLSILGLTIFCIGCGTNRNTINNCDSFVKFHIKSDGVYKNSIDTTIVSDPDFFEQLKYKLNDRIIVPREEHPNARSSYFILFCEATCADQQTLSFKIFYTIYSGVYLVMNQTFYRCNQIASYLNSYFEIILVYDVKFK